MKNLKKKSKKNIIKFLSIDPIFNIYTRRYMDYIINLKKLKNVYIIDFDGIGELNYKIGYDDVNKKFRKIFKKKIKGCYIGRFFSGDEMIFAFKEKLSHDDIQKIINKIEKRSKKQNLYFKYLSIDSMKTINNKGR